jgi:hypothetical protein
MLGAGVRHAAIAGAASPRGTSRSSGSRCRGLGQIGCRLCRFDLAGRACAPPIKLIGEAFAITPAHRGRPVGAQEAERKAQGIN